MFEKFCDYMYYLLTSPFKKIRKSLNQWYILFGVLGRRFDDTMDSLYNAADQTLVATCDPIMLAVHAADRKMTRYSGENDENFRKRIANYSEVLKLGGSDEGVILAVKTLGFDSVTIIKAKILKNDDSRWAEFYVVINVDIDTKIPVDYDILKCEVRKVKYVTALDNYQFIFGLSCMSIYSNVARSIFNITNRTVCFLNNKPIIRCKVNMEKQATVQVHIRNNLWFLNGTYSLDGSKILDAYETWEEL